MSEPTPERIKELAEEICNVFDARTRDFFQILDAGLDVGEQLHRDLTGKEPDYRSDDLRAREEAVGALFMGLELHSAGDPVGEADHRDVAARQLNLESELGKLVSVNPPSYLTKELGRPPRPTFVPKTEKSDRRFWVRAYGLETPLTAREAWERAAGAYVSVVEGRCAGDPSIYRDVQRDAFDAQQSIEGRVLAQHFKDTRTVTSYLSIAFDL